MRLAFDRRRVDAEVSSSDAPTGVPVCTVTRIVFPSWRSVARSVVEFRRLQRLAVGGLGLVTTRIRICRGRIVFILSVWERDESVAAFRDLRRHLRAVRTTLDSGAGVSSHTFELRGTSSMTVPWIGDVQRWIPIAWQADGRTPASKARPMCVVTRIVFPSYFSVLMAWWHFRTLRRAASHHIPGFVAAFASVSQRRIIYFFSLWESEQSVIEFTTLASHVEIVRWTIRHRGTVWSGAFDIRGARPNPIGAWRATAWPALRRRQQTRG